MNSPSSIRWWIYLCLAFFLTACGGGGGGGGGGGSAESPAPLAQSISFAQANAILEVGQSLSNVAAGGGGSGAITYSSSNTQVAEVDSAGTVIARGVGTADISAIKAADTRYAAATARYGLNVVLETRTISFYLAGPVVLYVGDTIGNGLMTVGDGAVTYRSSDTSVATVAADGQVIAIAPGTAVITADQAADAQFVAASASFTVQVPLLAQSILFSIPHPPVLALGQTLVNFATGPGSGAVVYRSSNTAVATVAADGKLTVVGAGAAQVTAEKAADAQHAAASATYTVTVEGIELSAWIGAANTRAQLPAAANGFELYSSSDELCVIASYLSCADGQLNVLNGNTVTETAATLTRPGYYVLKNGGQQAAVAVNATQFSDRYNHRAVEFNDRLWVVAGSTPGGDTTDDVWSSVDGTTWVRQVEHAGFPARTQHQLVVFNNQMWVIGGLSNTPKSDVWSSSDGINWTMKTSGGGFAARFDHEVVVFNNKLWVIGGYTINGVVNDVWSSPDGVTWTREIEHAAFEPRQQHSVASFAGRLWLIGGAVINFGLKSDVWSSLDGIVWTRQVESAPFMGFADSGLEVFNGQLCLVEAAYSSDVWCSGDGINWAQINDESRSFPPRAGPQVVVHHNRLWVIGGISPPSTMRSDVWSSADGATWVQHASGPAFSPRGTHQVATFDGRLWLFGGGAEGAQAGKGDIWSSADAITWFEQNPLAQFEQRTDHQVAVFNGRLWLLGGTVGLFSGVSDEVLSSADGVNWTVQAHSPVAQRYGHQMVVFDNQLWVIGGSVQGSLLVLSDVWSSPDGVNWTQRSAAAPFGDRSGYRVAVFDNQLWLIGGYTNVGTYKNDVWSSTDGSNWTLRTANAGFSGRQGHALAVYNNKLWLAGGYDVAGPSKNDVWFSSNGVSWSQATAAADFPQRYNHQLVVYDNKLVIIGGALDYSSKMYYNDVWSSTDGIEWRKGFRTVLKLQ